MPKTVVCEQHDDWDEHSPHTMVYGIAVTLLLDLMLGDTRPNRPNMEYPNDYVQWFDPGRTHPNFAFPESHRKTDRM